MKNLCRPCDNIFEVAVNQLQTAQHEGNDGKHNHRTIPRAIHKPPQAAEAQLNETDDFEAPSCKICFETKPDGYRWDTAFSIGNAELQKEFITFIRAKIRAKVEDIEAELIK